MPRRSSAGPSWSFPMIARILMQSPQHPKRSRRGSPGSSLVLKDENSKTFRALILLARLLIACMFLCHSPPRDLRTD